MAKKQLEHVKTVRRKGKVYLYFNTGKKRDGKPIYVRLPDRSAANFFDVYAALIGGRTKRGQGAYTVASLTDDYLASTTFARLAENTRKNYRTQAAKVKDEWGAFAANDLQSSDVRRAMESGAWKGGTCNMVLAVVGVIYRWGRRNKGLTINPTKDVDRQEVGQHEPWPEDVLEAALLSDDDKVRLAVHLLYFTGQRIGDVMKMRWGDIPPLLTDGKRYR